MEMRSNEITVGQVHAGPEVGVMRKEDLLQVAMLGALIANRELRQTVLPESFSEKAFQCAAAELAGSRGSSFRYLRETLLEILGVEWDLKDGSPLDSMVKRLSMNGKRNAVLDMLVVAARCLDGARQDEKVVEFFDAVTEAGHRANGRKQDHSQGIPSEESR